ncbi:TlpA family protein disulfide reductase [Chryseobacterium sp. MP_3.2]|uniref:TlpA family protein disulfide reductase n=1 Tax=Chryseobacterium sp. MP_3.2 TaxID=3071712 RepID=UPI002DFAC5C2|nr:thiol-disulfide isomerase/thioredoxin [Chryseobacterium sp. MP_3.2]
MSKYLLMLLVAFATMSCSKKVDVTGNFAGGSPLERVELIEASGIATLPLVNMGVDSKGTFSGSFEAPKNGMYIMAYAGKTAMVYLKQGQELNISGQAANFPAQFTVTGDAKNNHDFLTEIQKFIQTYAAKINVGELVSKKEDQFLKDVKKIKLDIEKNIDDSGKKTSADKEVIEFKKDELNASLLGLLNQYEIAHPQATQNLAYKPSEAFKNLEKEWSENSERMIKNHPIYRTYLLGKYNTEFQAFKTKNDKTGTGLYSDLYAQFLDTKKDMPQITKDYLLAFILASGDISPETTPENMAKIDKIIEEKIKDSQIKEDLKRISFVIAGPKIGETISSAQLLKQDGNNFKLSDATSKPTLLMFYASWNPYISERTVPVLKEVVNFYKSKVDFAFVNVDDTKDQFMKTSAAMMKGIPGTNLYAENGLNSQLAKDLGIYGFKLPSFVLIDKDGKVASKVFYELGDEQMVTALDKISGLKAPMVEPQVQLQNDLLAPQTQMPQPAPTK